MNRRGIAYIVTAQILAGTTYAVTAEALKGFSPLILVFCRTLIAGIMLLPVVIAERPYRRSDWLRLAAAGTLGSGTAMVFATTGLKLCGPAAAGLVGGMQPMAILVLSAFMLKESLTARKFTSVLLGIAGAMTLMGIGGSSALGLLNSHSKGILYMMIYAVLAAFLPVLAKPILGRVRPLAYTGITTLLALGPIAAAAWPQIRFSGSTIPLLSWVALIYLAVVGSIACRFLGCKALMHLPASEIAPYFFLQPLFGAFFGAAWEGRLLVPRELAGGALILAGVTLATNAPLLKRLPSLLTGVIGKLWTPIRACPGETV